MRWYTAIGMKKDDADGRFCVWVDGEEKVLTEMETILWAALTWSFCEEDKVHSQMHRLLVFTKLTLNYLFNQIDGYIHIIAYLLGTDDVSFYRNGNLNFLSFFLYT